MFRIFMTHSKIMESNEFVSIVSDIKKTLFD